MGGASFTGGFDVGELAQDKSGYLEHQPDRQYYSLALIFTYLNLDNNYSLHLRCNIINLIKLTFERKLSNSQFLLIQFLKESDYYKSVRHLSTNSIRYKL